VRTREKVFYVVAGIVMPLACFEFAHLNPSGFRPNWQAGGIRPWATLLFNIRVNVCFYLLMIWSMTALGLLLSNWERFRRMTLVRVGIYSGVVISAQYLAALALSRYAIGLLFIVPVGFAWFLLRVLADTSAGFRKAVLFLGAVALVGGAYYEPDRFALFLAAVLVTGPFWSLLAYGRLAWQVWRIEGPPHRLAGAGWIGLFAASWFVAIRRARELYASLPAEPGDGCYVATAAARGHRWLVGDAQLATFKTAEHALQARLPRLHRALRAAYDRLGPPVARRVVSPWLADLAYLSLKPGEWLLLSAGFRPWRPRCAARPARTGPARTRSGTRRWRR
jgi:hypothetical protein